MTIVSTAAVFAYIAEGLNATEAARRAGVTKQAMSARYARLGASGGLVQPRSMDLGRHDALLRQMMADGYTRKRMCECLGVSASALYHRLRALDLIERRPQCGRRNQAAKRDRECLCCRRVFASWGAGNRMCGTCRTSAEPDRIASFAGVREVRHA